MVGLTREVKTSYFWGQEEAVGHRADLGHQTIRIAVGREHERLILADSVLGDYNLLIAIDDKVATRVIAAFVFVRDPWELREHTCLRSHHDGDLANIDTRNGDFVALRHTIVVDDLGNGMHVDVQIRGIRKVRHTGHAWRHHELEAISADEDRFG